MRFVEAGIKVVLFTPSLISSAKRVSIHFFIYLANLECCITNDKIDNIEIHIWVLANNITHPIHAADQLNEALSY